MKKSLTALIIFLGSLLVAENSQSLWLAAYQGDLKAVQEEIKRGADPSSFNITSGQTALMLAAANNHLEILQELLKNGANFNSCDKDGYTALILASFTCNLKIIEELIKAKVNINAKTKDNKTALTEAIKFNCPKEIIEKLLSAGANNKDLVFKTNELGGYEVEKKNKKNQISFKELVNNYKSFLK
jgi:ankyrin repeat protein